VSATSVQQLADPVLAYVRVDVVGGLLGEPRPGVKHHRQTGVRPGGAARSAFLGAVSDRSQGGDVYAAGQCAA
jgi:hypothetical protein